MGSSGQIGGLIVGTWETFVKEVEVHSDLDYCVDSENFFR